MLGGDTLIHSYNILTPKFYSEHVTHVSTVQSIQSASLIFQYPGILIVKQSEHKLHKKLAYSVDCLAA